MPAAFRRIETGRHHGDVWRHRLFRVGHTRDGSRFQIASCLRVATPMIGNAARFVDHQPGNCPRPSLLPQCCPRLDLPTVPAPLASPVAASFTGFAR